MKEALTIRCGQCDSIEIIKHYKEQLKYLLEFNYWYCKKCNSDSCYIDDFE